MYLLVVLFHLQAYEFCSVQELDTLLWQELTDWSVQQHLYIFKLNAMAPLYQNLMHLNPKQPINSPPSKVRPLVIK
jgi:hypothetical protein